jgi:hypothetical protein
MIRADHDLHPCLGALYTDLRTFDVVTSVAVADLFPSSAVVPINDLHCPLFEAKDAEVRAGAEVAGI